MLMMAILISLLVTGVCWVVVTAFRLLFGFLIGHWWILVLPVLVWGAFYLINRIIKLVKALTRAWRRRRQYAAYRKHALRTIADNHVKDKERLRQAYEQANRDIDGLLDEWR